MVTGELVVASERRCGYAQRMRLFFLFAALAAASASAAPRLVHAGPNWAAFDHGGRCEAVAKSLRPAAKDRPQARASFSFQGRRQGELAVRLSRAARAGASVMLVVGNQPFLLKGSGEWAWSRGPAQEMAIIAAVRAAGGMRVESRDAAGRRIADRYLLAGVATAIDSAAAACS